MMFAKNVFAKRITAVLLTLCFALTAVSCAVKKNEPDAPSEGLPVSQIDAESEAEEEDAVVMHDLTVHIPPELEYASLSGAETSVYVNLEQAEDGPAVSWMSISPQRPDIGDTEEFTHTMTDDSGTPILTGQSVTDQYQWETEVQSVLDEGTLTVGGIPAAYIEAELTSEMWEDTIWQVRLTRAICNGIAYDFLYASVQDRFDSNLSAANGIIATAEFARGDTSGETAFWDITMRFSENELKATVSKEQIYLYNNRYRGNAPRFYAKHDNTVLYTDALLDDAKQVDRLLRIWSYNLVDQRFRQFHNPQEILREETEINGKRALRAVYHDEWEHNQYPEYMEILLFVHNYDLYILQSKGEIGYEDALTAFTKPIIDSIGFGNTVTQQPQDRPMPYSDTVKWLNDTYAILTVRNNADTDLVGGFLPTEQHVEPVQQMLFTSWGINDRKTSDEVIKSLYKTGHRARFQEFAKESGIFELTQAEFDEMIKDSPDEFQSLKYIYDNTREAYRLHGDQAILAWDYCRIIYLYCSGYIAGYYTYSEALDLSLPIALELQAAYSSWDEMYRDYMAGFHFWSPGDVNDTSTENYSRTQIMLKLEASPYALPWGTMLVADWHAADLHEAL